ncbi:DUF418 domain-containing protein [Alcaligenes aquatilis]|uniref:DUF418 domain-containing protein n=1 Tax=Alcaligenes aquatilis TaxID=323284 RepID=UPI003D1F6CBF
MSSASRNSSIDLIRTAALIGICVVNLPYLALSDNDPINISTTYDHTAAFLIEFLFQGKFFLLFSLIFGWGIEIQERSAERAGVPLSSRYFRRMLGLAVLGCLHATLVFTGDILLLYSVLGVLIWPLRTLCARGLVKVALLMVLIEILSIGLIVYLLSNAKELTPVYSLGGAFSEATLARISEWPESFAFLFLYQGPLAFGAMLMGLAAAKSNFFEAHSPGQQKLGRALPWLLPLALAINFFSASVTNEENLMGLIGLLSIAIGAPMLSAVYLYLLLRCRQWFSLPNVLIEAGRNSLSAYVTQGILAGLIFSSYGLNLFDVFGNATLLPIAIALALLAMVLTGLIAQHWGRGPLEAVLRRITYGAQKNQIAR